MSLSHLISIRDLTREEAILILDTAEQMAATQRHGVKKLPTLQGKTVVNLFFEDSTRTRKEERTRKFLSRYLTLDTELPLDSAAL